MKKATREHLAKVAKEMALVPFHGAVDGLESNLAPVVRPFPTWNIREADGLKSTERTIPTIRHMRWRELRILPTMA